MSMVESVVVSLRACDGGYAEGVRPRDSERSEMNVEHQNIRKFF
jgi:hypothetical protein